jgi:hypothetical protein
VALLRMLAVHNFCKRPRIGIFRDLAACGLILESAGGRKFEIG